MVSRFNVAFKAEDRSYFSILKKEIHALAVEAGFSAAKVGEIDIVVSEMVSNLIKHAGGGQVVIKLIEEFDIQGIEIISIDNGPGMTDVSRMVVDGVSTKNTLGQGLGAMKRLSDIFQVYSQKDWGTVILTRIYETELPRYKKKSTTLFGSVLLPKPGEQVCGDGFFYLVSGDYLKLFLGDGLGHGKDAAFAVTEAGNTFMNCTETEPSEIIRCINDEVKRTRGLVGTVAIFSIKDKTWRVCGVGNIMTRINGPVQGRNFMSYNGIIGLNVPRTMNAHTFAYEKGQQIIMCSDGLKSKWDTAVYPAIHRYDPSILSASLVKDFSRNTDDISAAVCTINL